jgi:hypothetical protein
MVESRYIDLSVLKINNKNKIVNSMSTEALRHCMALEGLKTRASVDSTTSG